MIFGLLDLVTFGAVSDFSDYSSAQKCKELGYKELKDHKERIQELDEKIEKYELQILSNEYGEEYNNKVRYFLDGINEERRLRVSSIEDIEGEIRMLR